MSNTAILALEREWDKIDGFVGRLSEGIFDEQGFKRTLKILSQIEVSDTTEKIDRRIVTLTWMIPVMLLQHAKVIDRSGGDSTKIEIAAMQIIELLYKVLGIP